MNNTILQNPVPQSLLRTRRLRQAEDRAGRQRRRSRHPGRRDLRHCRRERLRQVHAAEGAGGAVEPPLRVMSGRVCYRIGGEDVDVATLGAEEKRRLRLEYISYVPQGSMSVLNPVARIKDTYRDFIESHVTGKSKTDAYEIAREPPRRVGAADQGSGRLSAPALGRYAPARDDRPGHAAQAAHHHRRRADDRAGRGRPARRRAAAQGCAEATCRTPSSWSRTTWACTPTSPTASASCMPARSWKRRRPKRSLASRPIPTRST